MLSLRRDRNQEVRAIRYGVRVLAASSTGVW